MTLSHKTQLEQFSLAQQQQASGLDLQMQKALLAQQQQAHNPYLNQNPIPIEVPSYNLNEGAWDVPISQLVDLWTVRYGSKWVNEDELDEFYKVTAKRLRALHKVESHYVNGNDVFRIVE
jgi:hypothetical protein